MYFNSFLHWVEISGFARLKQEISVIIFLLFSLLILLVFLNIRRRNLKWGIVVILCILTCIFVYAMPEYLLRDTVYEQRRMLSQTTDTFTKALELYYNVHHRYPSSDKLLTELKKFLPHRFVNPYTGKKIYRVLHYDSILRNPHSLSVENLGCVVYKTSSDYQSCMFYFIDYESILFKPILLSPTRLERGKLKPLW